MEKLKHTADALRRLLEIDDVAATMVAERRIEELLAAVPQLERKIETLTLLRQQIMPTASRMRDYPKKQLAESVIDYIDHRIRMLQEVQSAS